ncbi:MAG: hypothetical protein ABR926_11535 [Streptosporangiaceae bacterium]
MIALARTSLAGSARRAATGLIPGPAGPADPAGQLLARLSVLPALLVLAWLLAGLPLLLLGVFTPVLTLVISVLVAAVLMLAGLRWIPGLRQESGAAQVSGRTPAPGTAAAAGPGQTPDREDSDTAPRTPWWAVVAVIAIAAAFGLDQMIYHAQQLIVMRDPAAYIQFGNWIAGHGSLPIPQDRAAFGGTHPGLNFDSFASYPVGSAVVPQFMAGLPMILAGGFWIGGATAATAMAPILGALAVLTFGGLAARLVGPRWAPLAALILAIALPMQFTARSTYSEPAAAILFLGGLCLVIDSLRTEGLGGRVTAALGGLALGMTLLVRIDGASDILPVLPYIGLLLIARRPQALPLLGGLATGAIYGVVDGLVLSRPYLATIKSSLIPLALLTVVILIGTGAAVLLLRRRGLPTLRGNLLPNAAFVLAFLILIAFAVRPYFQTVHGPATASSVPAMTDWQRADGLPIQPTRLYYEISLHWVFWYLGLPAVLLGTLGAALLARRCLQGRAPLWILPLVTFGWTIVTTLYRPAIVPDQPWASRRLVPAVLPGFIVLAVWAVRWIHGWLREQGYGRPGRAIAVAVCSAALVLPAAQTTLGLGIRDGGPLGLRPVAAGLAFTPTYRGEVQAVDGLCAAIPRDSSVLIVSSSLADTFLQLVRGMCSVPAARTRNLSPRAVSGVIRAIQHTGRQPVLLGIRRRAVKRYGATPRLIMALRTTQDSHTLINPPTTTWKLTVNVWMSEPSR